MDLTRYYYAGGSYNAVSQPSGAVTSFVDVVSSLSPTAWWRLGESAGASTAIDEQSVQNGTYTNSPTLEVSGYAAGDTAASFASASSQYVTILDSASWDIGTSDWSAHAAIKTSAWPANAVLETIVTRGNGGGAGDWRVFANGYVANRISLQFDNTIFNFDHSTTLSDSAWHALGLSCDRSANAVLYVDGSAAATASISSKVAVDMTGSRKMGIAATTDPSVTQYFDGSIDEVIFWNGTLLTATDWAELHGARNST